MFDITFTLRSLYPPGKNFPDLLRRIMVACDSLIHTAARRKSSLRWEWYLVVVTLLTELPWLKLDSVYD
jgi:hypothetical protein